MQSYTEYMRSVVDDNPRVIFFFLATVELIWNMFRLVFGLINIRYYLEIIEEVRQNQAIRLSDVGDNLPNEPDIQEFQAEILKEYPGKSHQDNIKWYSFTTSCFISTIFLDFMAMFSGFINIPYFMYTWMGWYFVLTTMDVAFGTYFLQQRANPIYLHRRWGVHLFNYFGFVLFRSYVGWMSYFVLVFNEVKFLE